MREKKCSSWIFRGLVSENAHTEHAPVELGSPNRTMLSIRASGQPFDRYTTNTHAKEER
jgi:hypothetical protein